MMHYKIILRVLFQKFFREEFEKYQHKKVKEYKQTFAELRAENADMKYQVAKLLGARTVASQNGDGGGGGVNGRRKNVSIPVQAPQGDLLSDISSNDLQI